MNKKIVDWYPVQGEKIYIDETNADLLSGGKKYGAIILGEYLEKSENPVSILQAAKASLMDGGRILLCLNNRLGIRYFCGDRDIYTERNFDGLDNYRRAYASQSDEFRGRTYAKSEIVSMLKRAGIEYSKFYSVLTDLDNPTIFYSHDYIPNEDMIGRVMPTYNYPKAVFLEENALYQTLIDNDIFHQMANAFLVECSLDGRFENILQVTSSAERDKADALYTIVYDDGTVVKRPIYKEGAIRLKEVVENHAALKERGIKVVESKLEDGNLVMPFINEPTAQVYLKRLLKTDKELFLQKLDEFRDVILKSSEIVSADKGDGKGAILAKGFFDLVPLNSFYIDGEYTFFDQEFVVENLPANVLLWRMVETIYAWDLELHTILPDREVLARYDLVRYIDEWRDYEGNFLAKLRQEKQHAEYHKKVRANPEQVNSNRQRMNYSADDYQRLFVDIFDTADYRKVILFGSGMVTKRFLEKYRDDFNIYAIVDNNEEKWGQELDGIQIVGPSIFSELGAAEYKVIVCIKNYLSVMKQLDSLGVKNYSIYDWNKNYTRPYKDMSTSVEARPSEPKKYHIGYVAGAFDMFHVGHLNLIQKAKELCDYLIVGVISDQKMIELKKKAPIIPEAERKAVLEGCKYVDQVEILPTSFATIVDAYNMFKFDVQFSGDDHVDDPDWLRDQAILRELGADVHFFNYTAGVSSTQIRESIKN